MLRGRSFSRRRKRGCLLTILAGILGGGLGGVAFIVFFFFVMADYPLLEQFALSLAAAGGVFIAVLLLWGKPKTVTVKLDGVTTESLHAALAEGERKLEVLRGLIRRVQAPAVRKTAGEIAELVRKILENIEADPKDLKPARQFLAYYFDATINIIRRYTDILERGASAYEVQASVAKVEPVLRIIKGAFEKQLGRLLENDVLDLDTEITVLEKTLKMEGLDQS